MGLPTGLFAEAHVGSGSSPAIRPAAPATQQEPGGLAGRVSGYMK